MSPVIYVFLGTSRIPRVGEVRDALGRFGGGNIGFSSGSRVLGRDGPVVVERDRGTSVLLDEVDAHVSILRIIDQDDGRREEFAEEYGSRLPPGEASRLRQVFKETGLRLALLTSRRPTAEQIVLMQTLAASVAEAAGGWVVLDDEPSPFVGDSGAYTATEFVSLRRKG